MSTCYQASAGAAEVELDEITMQILENDDAGEHINELNLPSGLQMMIDAAEHVEDSSDNEKHDEAKEQDGTEDSTEHHEESSTESKDDDEHMEGVEKPEEPQEPESPEEPQEP
ncbi:MAG: hypothetical protein KAQ67_00735, partial [Gammaproteobacteria bacterium]|nr:hypothetical protein [Gammaproteobacteria bacterium]